MTIYTKILTLLTPGQGEQGLLPDHPQDVVRHGPKAEHQVVGGKLSRGIKIILRAI